MTADLSWLSTFPGRCPTCLLDIDSQGHRAQIDGVLTGCTPSGPLGLLLARQARDSGMAVTTAAHPDAVALIDAAIMRRVKSGRPFTANLIRAELSSLSAAERPAIGARMNALCRRFCVKVGEEPSTDPGTHGKVVARWLAIDASAVAA
jgi:hypothetical protein